MTDKAFLDCYIWVVGAYDVLYFPNDIRRYQVKEIFKYNSLEDRDFKRQNDVVDSHSFPVQIPDFLIEGVTEEMSLSKKVTAIHYDVKKDKWFL
jgi:hypothetical protein